MRRGRRCWVTSLERLQEMQRQSEESLREIMRMTLETAAEMLGRLPREDAMRWIDELRSRFPDA